MPSLTPRIDNLEHNLIINGNFDFWQRGITGGVATGSGLYRADRFSAYGTSNYSGVTQAQVAAVPTVAQSGFASSFSWRATNGGAVARATSQLASFGYVAEGFDLARILGRRCRLQFWVRSSVVGQYSFNILNAANTRNFNARYNVTSANTWEKKVIDFNFENSGVWALTNGVGAYLNWNLAVGANFHAATEGWVSDSNKSGFATDVDWGATASATWQISQVMLIPGDFTSAPDSEMTFQRAGKTIQQELAMCQRYYEASQYSGGTSISAFASNTGGATNQYFEYFKVTKRVDPTTSRVTYATSGNSNIASVIVARTSVDHFQLNVTPTTPNAYWQIVNIVWTADAEL